MDKLEIFMLGNLKILLNGKPITNNMSNKAVGLLCYLSINKEKSFSRDKISSLFWDMSNLESARYNLRYNLWSLRKILKDDKKDSKFIITHKDSCKINPQANIYIDVFEMKSLAKDTKKENINNLIKSMERVRQVYKGEFLEGFYIKDCLEFNDWIFYEREKSQRKYFEVLYKLSTIYKSKKNYFKSIEIFEEMLRINPLQEEIYVELIKIYLQIGDRNSALQQYNRCCSVLREELNIGPAESTKNMYEKIKNCNKSFIAPYKNNGVFNNYSNTNILFTDNLDDFLDEFKEKEELIFYTSCYPLSDLPFQWASDLVSEIIKEYGQNFLGTIPLHYWQDIIHIESSVMDIIDVAMIPGNFTELTGKIRIFSSLWRILKEIGKNKEAYIIIKDFQWIDQVSYDLMKYLLLKEKNINIKFVLSCNGNISKLDELREYFTIQRV